MALAKSFWSSMDSHRLKGISTTHRVSWQSAIFRRQAAVWGEKGVFPQAIEEKMRWA